LLSIIQGAQEPTLGFTNNASRVARVTGYTAQILNELDISLGLSDGDRWWWWLRSPGSSSDFAALVNPLGSVYFDGYFADDDEVGVRPALKLNLASVAITPGNVVHIPGAAATCTAAQACTVCGATLVAATGHAPGAWVVDTQPTATTDGSRHKACTVCGQTVETGTIPATGGGGGGGDPVDPVDTTKYISLWGKTTGYVSNFLNWLLCIICFGWIWMAF
jgi:hypothetical protein